MSSKWRPNKTCCYPPILTAAEPSFGLTTLTDFLFTSIDSTTPILKFYMQIKLWYYLVLKITYIFLWYTKWSTDLKHSSCYIHSDNNWISSVKYGILNDFESTWENGVTTSSFFSIILALLNVSSKVIKQMIYNFGGENFNSFLFSKCSCVWSNTHIKCKNGCIFFFNFCFILLSQHFHCFQNILFMDWSDRNTANWNLGCQQEF